MQVSIALQYVSVHPSDSLYTWKRIVGLSAEGHSGRASGSPSEQKPAFTSKDRLIM